MKWPRALASPVVDGVTVSRSSAQLRLGVCQGVRIIPFGLHCRTQHVPRLRPAPRESFPAALEAFPELSARSAR